MRATLRLPLVLLLAGVGTAAGGILLAPATRTLASASHSSRDGLLDLQPLPQRSVVYARDGTVLAVLHAEENRLPVALDEVPTRVINAILDVEDERFYRHGGVDLRATLRALYANVHAGGIEQGGSTITQQLVKNALLTSKRDAGRKIKEAVLAVRLENRLSKREILERYLNTVYFGNGTYGVQAAAERYFGVDVGQLTSGQAALLAGLIRNPVGSDPFTHPDKARARRDLAVRSMARLGDVTPEEAKAIEAEPLPSEPVDALPKPDDYFIEEVKQRLLDDRRLGNTATERYNAVFKGGLHVYTTLDPDDQRIAEGKVGTLLPNTRGRFTAALVAIEPSTGAVRALVGGPGFEQAKYDLATQGHRQAGSAFKVFTLVTALQQGHSPRDTISGSSPCTIPNPGGTPDPWRPENFEGEGGGTMTLTDATVHSVNCAYARLALIVGLDRVAETAHAMGITSKLDPVPAMTLGALGEGVNPLQMASAYATLAADGVHHTPYYVERVADRGGKTIFRARPRGDRVIDSQDARVATRVLQEVVKRGTGTRARLSDRPVAGKTGTAQNYQDAWFVGFTPELATAVWMGSPVAEVPMRSVGGIRVVGGSYPARIWGAFMKEALQGHPVGRFAPPNERLVPRGQYLQLRDSRGRSLDGRDRSRGQRSRSSSRSRRRSSTSPSPSSPPASRGPTDSGISRHGGWPG